MWKKLTWRVSCLKDRLLKPQSKLPRKPTQPNLLHPQVTPSYCSDILSFCSKHMMFCVEESFHRIMLLFWFVSLPLFLAEPEVQRPSTSITKQPTPRAKPFPPAPPPVTVVTSDPPPDSPPKPEESSSETPQSTELKHRTTNKDLLEIDRFTICGNRIGWTLTPSPQ